MSSPPSIGQEVDRICRELAAFRVRISPLEDEHPRRGDLERTTEMAIAIADDRAESQEEFTKPRRVEKLSRTELVRNVVTGIALSERPRTDSEVGASP